MNQLPVSRGFYPVMAVVPISGGSGGPGSGKGGKGKAKKGKRKSKVRGGKQELRPLPNPITCRKAVLGSVKYLKGGHVGHYIRNCP